MVTIHHLSARLLNAQEAERARIARVLHDDISQQLALLMIDLELLSTASPATSETLVEGAMHRAIAVARSVHDLSHRLHPSRLRLVGLVAALRGLQQELARPNLAITFTHDDVPSTLEPDLTLCMFRTAQEALQNVLTHSEARHVTVHLTNGSNRLSLTVVDDGVGFDVDAAWGKGLGLISMSERLEAIGGTFEIRSQPGAGSHLAATAPLSGRADSA